MAVYRLDYLHYYTIKPRSGVKTLPKQNSKDRVRKHDQTKKKPKIMYKNMTKTIKQRLCMKTRARQ